PAGKGGRAQGGGREGGCPGSQTPFPGRRQTCPPRTPSPSGPPRSPSARGRLRGREGRPVPGGRARAPRRPAQGRSKKRPARQRRRIARVAPTRLPFPRPRGVSRPKRPAGRRARRPASCGGRRGARRLAQLRVGEDDHHGGGGSELLEKPWIRLLDLEADGPVGEQEDRSVRGEPRERRRRGGPGARSRSGNEKRDRREEEDGPEEAPGLPVQERLRRQPEDVGNSPERPP